MLETTIPIRSKFCAILYFPDFRFLLPDRGATPLVASSVVADGTLSDSSIVPVNALNRAAKSAHVVAQVLFNSLSFAKR